MIAVEFLVMLMQIRVPLVWTFSQTSWLVRPVFDFDSSNKDGLNKVGYLLHPIAKLLNNNRQLLLFRQLLYKAQIQR